MMKHGSTHAWVKTKSKQNQDALETGITLMKQSSSKHSSVQVGNKIKVTWIKTSSNPESRNTKADKSCKRPCLRQIQIEQILNRIQE